MTWDASDSGHGWCLAPTWRSPKKPQDSHGTDFARLYVEERGSRFWGFHVFSPLIFHWTYRRQVTWICGRSSVFIIFVLQHTFCPCTADPQELRATLRLWQGQYCERQELGTSTKRLGISMGQNQGGVHKFAASLPLLKLNMLNGIQQNSQSRIDIVIPSTLSLLATSRHLDHAASRIWYVTVSLLNLQRQIHRPVVRFLHLP